MPIPNFEGVPLFKKSKDQEIFGAAHEADLKSGSQWVQDIKHSKTFLSPKSFHIYKILKHVPKCKCQ